MRARHWQLAVVAAIAALSVTGCSAGGLPPAAKVGTRVVSEAELSQELSALDSYPAYAIRLKVDDVMYGNGPDGFSPAYVAQILTLEIEQAAAENILAAHRAPLPPRSVAATEVTTAFAKEYPTLSFNRLAAGYRNALIYRAQVTMGLAAWVGHTDVANMRPQVSPAQWAGIDSAVQDYLRTAKVSVAKVYGRFDSSMSPARVVGRGG